MDSVWSGVFVRYGKSETWVFISCFCKIVSIPVFFRDFSTGSKCYKLTFKKFCLFFFFFSFFLPGSVMLAMYQYTLVVQFLLSQWTCCWAGWIHTIIWSELAWILTGVNCLSTTDVKKQEMGLFSSVKRNFSYSEHFSTTTKKYNLLNIRELNCKMEEIWLRSQQ